LSIHLRLGLPSGLLPSGFPTNILYSCYMPCPSHPLDFIIQITYLEKSTSYQKFRNCKERSHA
jgi:hypothetical protein